MQAESVPDETGPGILSGRGRANEKEMMMGVGGGG